MDSRAETASVVLGALIVTALVAVLAWGFVPGATTLFCLALSSVTPNRYFCELVGFPLLAFLFSLSAPLPLGPQPISRGSLLRMSVVPVVLALLFGILQSRELLLFQLNDSRNYWLFLWNTLSIPLGEELLFRKWMFGWLERWFGKKVWPDTNPLPVSIWLTALGFSLWHFQNWGQTDASQVLLQVGYTFLAGIWLGMIRYRTGHWRYSFVAHLAMNLVY